MLPRPVSPTRPGHSHGQRLSLLLLALFLGLLPGCASLSTRTVQYVGAPRPSPSDPAQVVILQQEPDRPHDKLGEVVVSASISPSPTIEKIETALRRHGAGLGADAIVLVHDQTQTVGSVVMGPWWSSTLSPVEARLIIAVAIRYKQNAP